MWPFFSFMVARTALGLSLLVACQGTAGLLQAADSLIPCAFSPIVVGGLASSPTHPFLLQSGAIDVLTLPGSGQTWGHRTG